MIESSLGATSLLLKALVIVQGNTTDRLLNICASRRLPEQDSNQLIAVEIRAPKLILALLGRSVSIIVPQNDGSAPDRRILVSLRNCFGFIVRSAFGVSLRRRLATSVRDVGPVLHRHASFVHAEVAPVDETECSMTFRIHSGLQASKK